MKQLAKALDLVYSGELVSGVTTILVVAREPWEIMHEAAIRTQGQDRHALGEYEQSEAPLAGGQHPALLAGITVWP